MGTVKRLALVTCARKDTDDPMLLKEGVTTRRCASCDAELWVSPTTVALEDSMDITYACNPCGKTLTAAVVAAGHKPQFGIAPGALNDDTPADRRRRNELEARGFRDLTEEDL